MLDFVITRNFAVFKYVDYDTATTVRAVRKGFSNILDYSYKIITNLDTLPTQIGSHGRKNVPEICKSTKYKCFLEMTKSPAEVHFGYQRFLQLLNITGTYISVVLNAHMIEYHFDLSFFLCLVFLYLFQQNYEYWVLT